MDVGELKRRVAEIRWYHSIDLGHGIVTPGYDQSPSRLPKIRMPADLTGMTVLDVGAWGVGRQVWIRVGSGGARVWSRGQGDRSSRPVT